MTRSGVDVGPFAFLDPLLGRAALIVERHDPLGWARQVRHDEADAGIEFARMPLDLGHDAARRLTALRRCVIVRKYQAQLIWEELIRSTLKLPVLSVKCHI